MLALYNITIMFLSRTHNFSAVIYTHGTIVLRSTLKFCTHGIWKGTVSITFTSWCFSKWHLVKCLLSFVLRTLILMRTATSMATHSAVQIPFRYPGGPIPRNKNLNNHQMQHMPLVCFTSCIHEYVHFGGVLTPFCFGWSREEIEPLVVVWILDTYIHLPSLIVLMAIVTTIENYGKSSVLDPFHRKVPSRSACQSFRWTWLDSLCTPMDHCRAFRAPLQEIMKCPPGHRPGPFPLIPGHFTPIVASFISVPQWATSLISWGPLMVEERQSPSQVWSLQPW